MTTATHPYPDDVMRAAREVYNGLALEHTNAIARAILAERERAARVAEAFGGGREIPAYPVIDIDGEVVAHTKPSTGRRYADPVRIAAAIRKGE